MDTRAPNNRELRNFGLVLGAMLALLLGLGPLVRHHVPLRWPFALALFFWIAALAAPASLRTIYALWSRFGAVLGSLNAKIILTAIYFVFVVPMGLVMKLFGRDPLNRRIEKNAETYRTPALARRPATMEKPY
jgi:hypothetical protein